MKKDLIIFDLDGTLIDSSGDIAWAANETLKASGYETKNVEFIKENIGWGVRSLLERLMPGVSPEGIEEARARFLESYGRRLLFETVLYKGVRETIRFFREKGKKLAVVTNKPEDLSLKIIEGFSLTPYFDMVVGGDTLLNKKPHPEPLEKVMQALKVGPPLSVFVGDSSIDCETGKRAGVFTIGVSYGFRGKVELIETGCDLVIDEFDDLKGVID